MLWADAKLLLPWPYDAALSAAHLIYYYRPVQLDFTLENRSSDRRGTGYIYGTMKFLKLSFNAAHVVNLTMKQYKI